MKIELGTVRESPFVGIFCLATEKMAFVPKPISQKEEKRLSGLFGVEIVKASVANSSLLGVLAAANSKGLIVGGIMEEQEEKELENAGIRVKRLEGITAVGNLLAANDTKGICSSLFSEKQVKEIEKFCGIGLKKATIDGSDVVGASIVATNQGFLINKMVKEKEALAIEKHFGIQGTRATANAGDQFVGNSVVANSEAALAGSATTGFELARIDEGLRG
jgi:translation initiation factor 6